jgi:hypothetical protein
VLPRAQLAELARLVRRVYKVLAGGWLHGGAGFEGNTEERLLEEQAYGGAEEWWQG